MKRTPPNKARPRSKSPDARRRKAKKKPAEQAKDLSKLTTPDLKRLVNELGTHQAELEMQNEELRRTREELEASRDKFAEFYDLAPIGYLVLNARGLILDANLISATLLGTNRRSLINKPLSAFLAGREDQRLFLSHLAEVCATRDRHTCEVKLKREKGQICFAQLVCVAVDRIDNKVDSIKMVMIDITGRRQAEEARQESEERFRVMADTAPVMIWTSGADKGCTYFNKVWLEFTGRTMDQEAGSGWAEGVHPEDLPRCLDVYNTSFDARKEFRTEYRLRRFDGEYRWILDQGIPRHSGRNDFIGYIGTCIDITARKQAEEMVLQSEGRYRSLVELSPDAIAVHCEGKYVYINPAGAKIYGARRPGDIIGKQVLDLVPPDFRAFVLERMQQSYDQKAPTPLRESKLLRLDGSCLDVEVATAPITYNGKPATQMILRDISERKRIEDSLRRTRKKMEEEHTRSTAIMSAIGDGISIQDRNFTIVYQNEAQQKFTGSHVGEYCYQAYEKRDSVCEDCPVALTFRDGETHTVERKTQPALGSLCIEIISFPLRDLHGNMNAVIEVARDITSRKQAEKDLRLFRTLIDQSNDFIFVADPKSGRFLDCNERACEKLGYTRREMLSLSVSDISVQLTAKDAWKQRVEDIVRHGSRIIEGHHRCKDGSIFPVEINVMPVAQEGRHYLVAIIRDISERKRMENERENAIKELQDLVVTVSRSRQEWSDTFDNIQDPIYITDGEYRIMKANKAFAAYVGKGFPEILNQECYKVVHGSCGPYMDCPHKRIRETGIQADVELVEPKSKRTLVVTHFPYPTSGGTINIVRDVTEEREKEMRFIMNERLASLGQMAASIAHEINNPLAAIMGCAEGLVSRVKQGDFEPLLFMEYLEIIEEEIARCQKISTSMLSSVRKTPLEKKTIDVHETLDRSLEVIGFQGRLKAVEIRRHYAFPGMIACGNESELKQVFLTVIANALDAMGEQGALTLETGAENGSLFIRISDTGGGIPPEQISRIFDPFFTTKSVHGGTGIGLTIAKKILVDLNGDIGVASELGRGSTFTIKLPID